MNIRPLFAPRRNPEPVVSAAPARNPRRSSSSRRTRRNPVGTPDTKTKYQEFHHGPSQGAVPVEVPDHMNGMELFVIGLCTRINYKPYGSSQKPHEEHTHEFGDYGDRKARSEDAAPLLVSDAKDNLYIVRRPSNGFYLNGRGIVG